MNSFAQMLQPPDECLAGLNRKPPIFGINVAANRVINLSDGKFFRALIPSPDAALELSKLPLNASMAKSAIEQSASLAKLAPMLTAMQLTSSVAAIASVATLGVVCVGFALVLHRLNRIDGKLDEALARLEALKRAVQAVANHQEALSVAGMRTASELVERAVYADTARTRTELAAQSRNLFHKTRQLDQELWRRADPMLEPEIGIRTAMELQGRIVACAVGELQAEFVGGDMGAFAHAAATVSRDVRQTLAFDPMDAFGRRCDFARNSDDGAKARFCYGIDNLTDEISIASNGVEVAVDRLAGYADDAQLVRALNIVPHEFLREIQRLPGNTIYTVPLTSS